MTTALLLIDFQRDFGAPDGAMAGQGADLAAIPAALALAERLAAAARAAAVPVVFVRLAGDALCIEGTPGADFIGPQPKAGDRIVSKKLFSAFHDTGLAEALKTAGVTDLVLAGLTTECCVAASAWAAFEHGFRVGIATDACAAYTARLHDGALEALQLSGADLRPASGFIQDWK